jgi:spore germination protein KA
MFNSIKRIFSLSDDNKAEQLPEENSNQELSEVFKVSSALVENKEYIMKSFSNSSDLIVRKLKITNNPRISALLVYIFGMVKESDVSEMIIEKLSHRQEDNTYPADSVEYSRYLLGIEDKDISSDMNKVINAILKGKVILLINGICEAISISIKNPPSRSIEEPQVETVMRGPREGFTESIATNIVLLRKKIKSTKLNVESFVLGKETQTDVAIVYLSNIADEKIVNEVRARINKIDIDFVLGSNYIKEFIEDAPSSSFPTIFSTERPEIAASKLLEGRVLIVVDGTPLVSSVPAIFLEFMLASDDFYLKFFVGTFNRWIRYISFIISLTLPAVYVAITTFHQELIPTALLTTFIKARSGVPYPALFECFMMLLVFEILREAGVRIPRTAGQAISIVGALVLGQAAVDAGLVSTPMVIVVATTSISAYAIPSVDMSFALTFPRMIFLMLGGTLGLIGLMCGLVIFAMRLMSIRSFGVPYMWPLAPLSSKSLPDLFIRYPFWIKNKTSKSLAKSIRRKS